MSCFGGKKKEKSPSESSVSSETESTKSEVLNCDNGQQTDGHSSEDKSTENPNLPIPTTTENKATENPLLPILTTTEDKATQSMDEIDKHRNCGRSPRCCLKVPRHFCQCALKQKKQPASCPVHVSERSHSTGTLPKLKPSLALSHCQIHKNNKVDVFCLVHQQPMCMLCASSAHVSCMQLRKLNDIMQERLQKQENVLQRLRTEEMAPVDQQRMQAEDKLLLLQRQCEPLNSAMSMNPSTCLCRFPASNHHTSCQYSDVYTTPASMHTYITSPDTCRLPTSCNTFKTSPDTYSLPTSSNTFSTSPDTSSNTFIASPDTCRLPTSSNTFITSPDTCRLPTSGNTFITASNHEVSPPTSMSMQPLMASIDPHNPNVITIKLDFSPGVTCNELPPLPPKTFRDTWPLQQSNCCNSSIYGRKPSRAAWSKQVRVGDRVKKKWSLGWPGDGASGLVGTVTAVPSTSIAADRDSTGMVHVLWDAGWEGRYCMGRFHDYDLELV